MRDGVEKSMGDVFQPDRRNGKGSENNGAGIGGGGVGILLLRGEFSLQRLTAEGVPPPLPVIQTAKIRRHLRGRAQGLPHRGAGGGGTGRGT